MSSIGEDYAPVEQTQAPRNILCHPDTKVVTIAHLVQEPDTDTDEDMGFDAYYDDDDDESDSTSEIETKKVVIKRMSKISKKSKKPISAHAPEPDTETEDDEIESESEESESEESDDENEKLIEGFNKMFANKTKISHQYQVFKEGHPDEQIPICVKQFTIKNELPSMVIVGNRSKNAKSAKYYHIMKLVSYIIKQLEFPPNDVVYMCSKNFISNSNPLSRTLSTSQNFDAKTVMSFVTSPQGQCSAKSVIDIKTLSETLEKMRQLQTRDLDVEKAIETKMQDEIKKNLAQCSATTPKRTLLFYEDCFGIPLDDLISEAKKNGVGLIIYISNTINLTQLSEVKQIMLTLTAEDEELHERHVDALSKILPVEMIKQVADKILSSTCQLVVDLEVKFVHGYEHECLKWFEMN